jgi:two-component system sensor histidine kinase HydH
MEPERPRGFEEIRREELSRLMGRMLGVRKILQPLVLSSLVFIVATDVHWWRSLMLAAMCVGAFAGTIFAIKRFRREPTWSVSTIHTVVMPLMVGALCAVTGGLRSPFLPVVLMAVTVAPIGYTPRKSLFLAGLVIILVWGLALSRGHRGWMMPHVFTDGSGHLTFTYDLVMAFVLSVFAIGGCLFGISSRRMSDDMLQRSLEVRDELLSTHHERLHELTTLSGEIAHELKNPLASIKGLVHLVACDPAKAPERLKVLRGEVDRMQAVLDEFLNFSRPLVPLSQESVDLGELSSDVLDLHEGQARERGIVLVAPASSGFEVRCDKRKVKQILINLIQNAIDASPKGGEVHVTVEQHRDRAVLCVLDRGPGLPPEESDRVFEAGFTSKARGAGLGLTIVRALAEQHGGCATVRNRGGGGCVAEVLLPIAGAPGSCAEVLS